jgi:hypothetical protein
MPERMLDKTNQPTFDDMTTWIGRPIAKERVTLRRFLEETYHIVPIFNNGGKRYGWNLQYRISKRPLCEMYPEKGSFTALVILGKAELEIAIERIVTYSILVQKALVETPRYHDGCWMSSGIRSCYMPSGYSGYF